jgi:hypothetical protein
MATREQALRAARDSIRFAARDKKPARPMAIYRVGPAWMFTSQTLEQVQSLYKVPVKDWEPVTE